jgi:predicted outer membrane repeat protein
MRKQVCKFLLLVPLIFAEPSLADHITVQGEVSGEWNTDTVLVTGDLAIPDGETLLIQPGTVVEFQGSFAFFVEGSIQASGFDKDSIFFRIADTTGFYTDTIPNGGWQGIRFNHNRITNEPSVFYKCCFSYGKMVSMDLATGNGGAIYINDYDHVMIDECHFHDNFATFNGGAVYLDSADVTIRNSVFINNRCGLSVSPWGYGGAVSSDNSSPDVRWNIFTGNSSTGCGGALSVRFKDCNIYNNVFTGNLSALGGALGVLHIPEIIYRINNNLLEGNSALYFGGGVATIDCSPIYINNTIINNQASYGGGFYCKDSISPDFYNTILWGNTAAVGSQGYLFEVFSQADFFNCDIEGGPVLFGGSGGGDAFSGTFEQCLDSIPGFLGYGDHPYSLGDNSPLIEMGTADTTGFYLPETDLAGAPRIFMNYIDIGAYEWIWVGLEEKTVTDNRLKVYPNPFTDHFTVEVDLKEDEPVFIEVFDMMGRKVSEIYRADAVKGVNQFLVNNINDIGGIVLLRLTCGQQVSNSKLYIISHR